MAVLLILRDVIIGPQEYVPVFLFDEPVDVGHVAGGNSHAALAASLVEGYIPAPPVPVHPSRGMDHDAAGISAAVGVIQPFQPESSLVHPTAVAGDFKTADRGTVATGDVAEDWNFISAALPGPVHGITGIDHPSFFEGPHKKARPPARDPVIQEQAIMIVQPFSLSICMGLLRPELHLWISGIARDSAGAEQAEQDGGHHCNSEYEEPE